MSQSIDRREFIKGNGLSLAGIVLGRPTPPTVKLECGVPAEVPARVENERPADWPESTEQTAHMFGGKSQNWRQDLYTDAAGVTQWGGAWVFEAFPLKVTAKADGKYVDAAGKPMKEEEIFNFKSMTGAQVITMGPYADNKRAFGTAWLGGAAAKAFRKLDEELLCKDQDTKGIYFAGYGDAWFIGEQAVIRPIPEDSNLEERALRESAATVMKFIVYDPDISNKTMAVWDQDNQTYRAFKHAGNITI